MITVLRRDEEKEEGRPRMRECEMIIKHYNYSVVGGTKNLMMIIVTSLSFGNWREFRQNARNVIRNDFNYTLSKSCLAFPSL